MTTLTPSHPRTLPLRQGGVMRCCVQTLDNALFYHEKEGDVLPCRYCSSSLIVRDGAWEWNSPQAVYAKNVPR
ncbi:MAG: hypothetical protein Q8R07_05640 [Candidatus Uhrbacteria bacterium]|nr:hypothetical protein [Candidatus Uhrbacteria bacterium]